MKKHILFSLAAIILTITNCTKPEEGGNDNPQPPAPSQEQITIPSTVDVTPVVPPEGGDAKITFTAAAAWTASVVSTRADSWVDVNPKSGNPGPAEIKITTTPNDTYVERNATIQIKCGGQTKEVVLTQKQVDNITVTTDKVEIGAEGGSIAVEVSSNVAVSMTIPEDSGWITENKTKSVSTSTFHLDIAANETYEARSAEVTFSNEESGLSEKITVNQKGKIYVPVTDMVDLGLSVKWATCNIGASKPEEYGGYYQWAGLEDVTSTSIYLYWDNCPCHIIGSYKNEGWTKYVPSDESIYWSGDGSPDNKTVLDPEDDIAYVTLGGKWRMPTDAEFNELCANCTWTWTNLNGVDGYKVTSNISGYTDKWIFLPAAGYRAFNSLPNVGSYGYYWSSSLYTDNLTNAYELVFGSDHLDTVNGYRYDGRSVRPVYIGNETVKVSGVSLNQTKLNLNIGETYTLSATVTPSNATNRDVKWTSSGKGVATVDQSGKVTAVGAGSATITVTTTDGGYTATCSVTVKNSDNPPTPGNSLVGTSWVCSFSDVAKYNTIYMDITLTFDSQSTCTMVEEQTNVVIEHYVDLDGDGKYDEYVEGGTYHDSHTEYGTYTVNGSSLKLTIGGYSIFGTIYSNTIKLEAEGESVIFQKQ